MHNKGENGNTPENYFKKHSHSKALFLPWLLSASAGGGQRRQSVDLPLGFISVRPPFPPPRFLLPPPPPAVPPSSPSVHLKASFLNATFTRKHLIIGGRLCRSHPAPAAKQGMPGKPSATFLHTPLCLASARLFSKKLLLAQPPSASPRLHRTGEVALCE